MGRVHLGVFFLLSKILDLVLLPTVWLLILLAAALLARQPHRRRQWLWAALVLTFIGTNSALINEALLAWELPAAPLQNLPLHADAAVLLTGWPAYRWYAVGAVVLRRCIFEPLYRFLRK